MKDIKQLLVFATFFLILIGCGRSSLTDRNNSLHSLIGEDSIVGNLKERVPVNTVLSHQSNKEGSVIEITKPTFGIANISEENDRTIIYRAQKDFVGEDSFSYEILFDDGRVEKETLFIDIVQ